MREVIIGLVNGLFNHLSKFKSTYKVVCITILIGLVLAVIFGVFSAYNSFKSIRIDNRKIKIINKNIELSQVQQDSIEKLLKRMRENETIIIHSYDNDKVHIKTISDDSLQFWVDSLYGSK